MNTFYFHNPTKIFFGPGAISNLKEQLTGYQRVLIAYGGGSIKRNGIYETALQVLEGKTVLELPGVMPNPRTEKVYQGIRICKENSVDFILAIGGGSVIDCVKAIAAGAKTDKDFWQTFYLDHEPCEAALPIGSVLTLAGTGSEMNGGSVISDWENNIKTLYDHALLQPQFAVLDPEYTYSLPKEQVINGAVDTLSHVFEQYFSKPDESNVSDYISEGIMKCVIENLPVAVREPQNYTARANLMWCSTLALNGLIKLSKEQDWFSHQIEHTLSAYYDIAHGAGLAIVHPNYLKYIYKNAPAKFARYAKEIWQIPPQGKTGEELALAGIERTRAFFKEMGAPVTLGEVGIPADRIPEMVESIAVYPTSYYNLAKEDVEKILRMCLE